MAAEAIRSLIDLSLNEKRGLTFFLPGQTVVGIVTEVIGTEAVVARSQTYSKIIIRLEKVLAVAIG